jgi:hypothetical protein
MFIARFSINAEGHLALMTSGKRIEAVRKKCQNVTLLLNNLDTRNFEGYGFFFGFVTVFGEAVS